MVRRAPPRILPANCISHLARTRSRRWNTWLQQRELQVDDLCEDVKPGAMCVNLIEVLASRSKIFIVLELATGGELFNKVVACGRFDEPTARRYFLQLVSGLDNCHQKVRTAQTLQHPSLAPSSPPPAAPCTAAAGGQMVAAHHRGCTAALTRLPHPTSYALASAALSGRVPPRSEAGESKKKKIMLAG